MKSDFPGWWRCDNCGSQMKNQWRKWNLGRKELCKFCYGLLKKNPKAKPVSEKEPAKRSSESE